MAERWTDGAMGHLATALNEAKRRSHTAVEPEHLVWADLQQTNGLMATAAGAGRFSLAALKALVDERLSQLPVAADGARIRPQFSERLKQLISDSRRVDGRDPNVPLDWPSTISGLFARYDDPLVIKLRDAAFDTANLAPMAEVPARSGDQAERVCADDPLSRYCRDLTALAEEGRIAPVIGRDAEIEQIILILAQRTTNNPLLLGEPGVGKTAIVEGLAHQVSLGAVPRLADRRILELDLNSMLAGASYRGEFEERLKLVVDAVIGAAGKYVLFVDEVHTLMGAGKSGEGPDAANLLKPPLARGELRMIGATTYGEYKQHLESDAAFARRFQNVRVPEPTPAQMRRIMAGVCGRYAEFHGVRYDDDALDSIVELSDRYIGSTNFPDKAIKVMDRAGVLASVAGYDGRGTGAPRVDTTCVIKAVAQIANLPRERIAQNQEAQLQSLEQALTAALIAQTEPITRLVNRLRLSLSPFRDPRRPRGILMFTGPAAVGKTTAARMLAQQLYATEEQLIELDMAAFAEPSTSSRLIGSSAGYVGYGEGGLLTEAVWRAPFSLVLLEQIDLAHEQVLNLLATAFSTGSLTDNAGKVVRMTECLFVMTSRRPVEDALPASVRSWLDESISFNHLSEDHAPALARLALRRASENLTESVLNLETPPVFELDASADSLVRAAFDSAQGALSIERHVDQGIIGELVRQYGQQDWSKVRRVAVRAAGQGYTLEVSA